MIQVSLKKLGKLVPFGPPVEDLSAARTVVKVLDWMLKTRTLPLELRWYTRNVNIVATGTYTVVRGTLSHGPDEVTGQWDYMDQDPSGASDGVWS